MRKSFFFQELEPFLHAHCVVELISGLLEEKNVRLFLRGCFGRVLAVILREKEREREWEKGVTFTTFGAYKHMHAHSTLVFLKYC